jgi:urea transport system substrate-binding protein
MNAWAALLLALITMALLFITLHIYAPRSVASINVGVFDEPDIKDAELLALDEINAQGGLLGKNIKSILINPKASIKDIEGIINKEDLKALFGCMSLSCRYNIRNILNKNNILLLSAGDYDKNIVSPFIVSTAATPNLQVIPAVTWAINEFGTRLFIIGARLENLEALNQDHIISHIKKVAYAHNASISGEAYISAHENDSKKAVEILIKSKPKMIINLLRGDNNIKFFDILRKRGISSEKIPTISLNITERDFAKFNFDHLIGDYVAQNYFQNVDTPSSQLFVSNFKKKYGEERVVDNPMENAYSAVYFWKRGVIQGQSFKSQDIREYISKGAFAAPEGIISIDKKTQYSWKPVLIGRIFHNKQFGLVWSSVSVIQPLNNTALGGDL